MELRSGKRMYFTRKRSVSASMELRSGKRVHVNLPKNGDDKLLGDESADDLNDASNENVPSSDFDHGKRLTKRSKFSQENEMGQSVCKSGEPKLSKEAFEGEETGVEKSRQRGDKIDANGAKDKKKRRKKEQKPVLMWNVWEEENERWVDENMTEDIDLDQNDFITETVEPPSELVLPLLRFQKEWLAWALKQEDSEVKGGILADEMGMGKTIQAIALVLAKRGFYKNYKNQEPSLVAGSTKNLPLIKSTLVICPVVAVSQWASEIDRFTLRGSTKVLIYHGANREKNSDQFSKYDFVITTYSIIEAEYRKYVMPPKDRCPYCGKLFHERKLKIHLRYFCGPNATKTERQSKQERKKAKAASSKSELEDSVREAARDYGGVSTNGNLRKMSKLRQSPKFL